MIKYIMAGLLFLAAVLLLVAYVRVQLRTGWLLEQLAMFERKNKLVLDFLGRTGEQLTRRGSPNETLNNILKYVVETTGASAGAVFLCETEKTWDGKVHSVAVRDLPGMPARPASPESGSGGGAANDPGGALLDARTVVASPDVFLRARVVEGIFPPLTSFNDKLISRTQYLAEKLRKERIPLGEGIVGKVAIKAEPLLLANAKASPEIPETSHSVVEVTTLMAAPLRVRGALLGVIVLVNLREEGKSFTEDDLQLLAALADQAAVTVHLVRMNEELAAKQRLEQELRVAHDIQQMLLPRECPKIRGIEIAATSTPAQEVGGDYFDFIQLDEHRYGIAIADVAGKGIPGAMVMASVRASLRAEAQPDRSPRMVLQRLNRRLKADTAANVFVTMTYAVLDCRTMKLNFARAGHEPLVVFSPEAPEKPALYTPNGIALGLVEDAVFSITQEREVDLREGEVAVLYTDGVVEAMNRADEEYGFDRLVETLRRSISRPAQQILDTVIHEVVEFTAGRAQHDDLTMIVLRMNRQANANAGFPGGEAEGRGEAKQAAGK